MLLDPTFATSANATLFDGVFGRHRVAMNAVGRAKSVSVIARSLANCWRNEDGAALSHHVAHIVGVCTKK